MELAGKWVRAFGGAATQNVLIPQMNTAEITFLPMRPKCSLNKDETINLCFYFIPYQDGLFQKNPFSLPHSEGFQKEREDDGILLLTDG